MTFAQKIWDFQNAQSDFEEALEGVGLKLGEDYSSIGWDEYDNSIEFYKVGNDVRLTPEMQSVVYDAGFSIAFVSHLDGWETHYTFGRLAPFVPARGWRRRWVADPSATTTRSIGAKPTPENAGYYEISYWPESWGRVKDWVKTGFMRIVPDPKEQP